MYQIITPHKITNSDSEADMQQNVSVQPIECWRSATTGKIVCNRVLYEIV